MKALAAATLTSHEFRKILSLEEGHFVDLKSKDVSPAKLTKSLSGFANAEGGELYVGIDEDIPLKNRVWRGFDRIEDANGFIQCFEGLFPLGDECNYGFLQTPIGRGFVLKVEIRKSKDVKPTSDGKVYVRRGAQNLPVGTDEALQRLKRNKGLTSFETEPVAVDKILIANSDHIIRFMLEVVPTAEPEPWLKKQQVILQEKPTVAGLLLFADEPQAAIPKRCGLKIYRYKTKDQEGTRETLAFDPVSVEGCAYDQIQTAVQRTAEIMESVKINTPNGLQAVTYPSTALHEIITNAVLHRDYSIADDIHIRIFDNRVEVMSPGTLPAHITPSNTPSNILEERFARNGTIVRLINKFPNPPNKDVGEGLNTAFDAMRAMKLKPPIISQDGSYVKARDICFIGSENKMKRIIQGMISNGMLERVPGTTRYTAAYRLCRRKRR